MNKEKLTEALRELNAVSGFRISVLDSEMNEIASYPEEKHLFCAYIGLHSRAEGEECRECRRKLAKEAKETGAITTVRCRHGLIESVCPLYSYGVQTGYLFMSGILPESETSERMTMALAHLGQRETDARAMARSMPTEPDLKIASLIRVIAMCSEHLEFSSAITVTGASTAELTRRYIGENYKRHIGIKDICEAVGYSKSTVLSAFKRECGETVGAYLCSVRLLSACDMLKNPHITVAEVAALSGFSDQSYFSKVFSAKFGKTPTDYRREVCL